MIEDDFRAAVERKRRGGVRLHVGVSSGVWMGGMIELLEHAPFVCIGPEDFEGEEELTFFGDRSSLEAFVERLRAAANEAWGAEPER